MIGRYTTKENVADEFLHRLSVFLIFRIMVKCVIIVSSKISLTCVF